MVPQVSQLVKLLYSFPKKNPPNPPLSCVCSLASTSPPPYSSTSETNYLALPSLLCVPQVGGPSPRVSSPYRSVLRRHVSVHFFCDLLDVLCVSTNLDHHCSVSYRCADVGFLRVHDRHVHLQLFEAVRRISHCPSSQFSLFQPSFP